MGHLSADDARWMGAALALGERGRGRTAPNPNVGCLIVRDGRVVGRGWTQPGGRPHAEAMALAQAGEQAPGSAAYVTLEPCAHASLRGPACTDLLIEAGVTRVVAAAQDADPRTAGAGLERLSAAGVAVSCGLREAEALASYPGFVARQRLGRPHVTLKLATSLDGCIALADGSSRWITGAAARAHAHLERARSDIVIVGHGTARADDPLLDVRLEGLAERSPARAILTGDEAGFGRTRLTALTASSWRMLRSPEAIAEWTDYLDVLVEGGAGAAASFLRADLVDRLLLYRAPILIGAGKPSLGDIGLTELADAHERWRQTDARTLGSDRLEVYVRQR